MSAVSETALVELRSCHDDIREGTFRRELITTVVRNSAAWRAADPPERLQGAVVASEIYDYYGMFDEAKKALNGYRLEDFLSYLKTSASKRSPTFGYAARKVIQYAAQKVGHLRAVHSTWF